MKKAATAKQPATKKKTAVKATAKKEPAKAPTAAKKASKTTAQAAAKNKATKASPKATGTIRKAESFTTDWPYRYYFSVPEENGKPKDGESYYVRADIVKYKKGYRTSFYREKFIESEGTFSEETPFATDPSPNIPTQEKVAQNLKKKKNKGISLIFGSNNG